MARRPAALVAVVTGLVLVAEAVGAVWLHWFLGEVVSRQSMSLAGLDPDHMGASTLGLGIVLGLFLLGCAVTLVTAGVRNRAPRSVPRVLLIACAVLHAVLGALTVGLVGWDAFAFLMTVFGLIVFCLLGFAEGDGAPPSGPATADGGTAGAPAHP
ncbi:hypothetical protein [Streptomyces zingiberis]|uniref:Integral membrane protein n=1 Tax=Streptomyces zingiberis TaxID=2053010 RepID=A0ABX1BSB3_9ACTN|nr:hypothetical protein [Streptomyces zingiberis]NJQ00601.1 hypothetical protein [Streptomyces zingiberis]